VCVCVCVCVYINSEQALYAMQSSSNACTIEILIFTIATTTTSRYKIIMSQRLSQRRQNADFTSERFATAAMMTVTTAGVKVQDTMAFYPFEPRAKGSRRRALEPAERTNHAAHSSYHGRTILSSRVEFNAYRLQGRRVCCIRASRCWRLDNGVAAR